MAAVEKHQMIEINLNAPTTPEDRKINIAGNAQALVPYIDGAEANDVMMEARQQHLSEWSPEPIDDGKPRIRFFAVGPSTHQIHCPLCQQRTDTVTVEMSGILGRVTCCLSILSCCFPIFALSFVYCCLQSQLKSKRIFCNKCGGHLGYYRRPV